MENRHYLFSFLVVAGALCSGGRALACTDRLDPLASPATGVSLLFSNGQGGGVGVATPRLLPGGRLAPPAVSPALKELKAGKFDQWGGDVVFTEDDGRGGKRVCRVETWKSRTLNAVVRDSLGGKPERLRDSDGRVAAIAYMPTPAQERHPVLVKLLPHYYMSSATAFYYDGSNNLIEVDRYMSPEANRLNPKYPLKIVARSVLYCFRYEDGRLVQSAGLPGPSVSKDPAFSCGQLKAGEHSLERYRYNANGTLRAMLNYYGEGDADASDSQRKPGGGGYGSIWLPERLPSGEQARAELHFNAKDELTNLSTTFLEFAAADAQPSYAARGDAGGSTLEYRFPGSPVPLSVIDEGFAAIGSYPRVRIFPHRSGMTVSEVFDAGSRKPRQRQWRSLDLNRQEMYGGNGKLTRVVQYGAAPQDAYEEDLKGYAESGVLKVTPTTTGYASYRVYDYDTAGKERLTFVCWQHDVPSNKPLRHFPWWTPDPTPKRSREEALVYGMKNVANRCGTPDGKMVVEGLAAIDSYMAKTYGYDVEKLSYGEAR